MTTKQTPEEISKAMTSGCKGYFGCIIFIRMIAIFFVILYVAKG